MIMFVVPRSDFMLVNKLFPHIAATVDYNHIYWLMTYKQYKFIKDRVPNHQVMDLRPPQN